MSENGQVDEQAVAKGLAHPMRAEALRLLQDRQRAMSPSEVADVLGVPLVNLSYHVRMLFDLGLLELVDEKPRRGAVEHFYRARVKGARVSFTVVE